MRFRRNVSGSVLLGLVLLLSQTAQAEEWTLYRDPQLRFQIELPTSGFRQAPSGAGHLELNEIEGDATIEIYAGNNLKHLTPTQFAQAVSQAGVVKDITYRAGGRSWFVISGHYTSTGSEPALIYYAKYLFSKDFRRVVGFEINYPPAEKSRMDTVIEGLERSLLLP